MKELKLSRNKILFFMISAFGCGFGLGMAFIGVVLIAK